MVDKMKLPEYWEDFVKEYSFKADTNGSEVISVFRVKQMVDEYFSTGMKAICQAMLKEFRDNNSYVDVSENNCITLHCLNEMDKAIDNYNKGIVSKPVDLTEVE